MEKEGACNGRSPNWCSLPGTGTLARVLTLKLFNTQGTRVGIPTQVSRVCYSRPENARHIPCNNFYHTTGT
eukprot:189589-Rhodomonas_salina.1